MSEGDGQARPWDADVELDAAQVRALIAGQIPALGGALAAADPEPVGQGFDNAAWRIGPWLFRFPRRRIAADFMAAEIALLPRLAPLLPAPIPAPAFAGAPAGGYPYPFAGYRMLPGRTACGAALSADQEIALARDLGGFLRALHGLPTDPGFAAGAPGDLLHRADCRRREAMLLERLAGLGEAVEDPAAIAARIRARAAAPPFEGPPRWCHGDVYARHLLLDDAGRLAGVIDWGDVHLGDPAVDLGVAFAYFSGASRAALLEAYGPVGAAALERARFRGLHYGVLLLEYGLAVGDAAMARLGRRGLRLSAE